MSTIDSQENEEGKSCPKNLSWGENIDRRPPQNKKGGFIYIESLSSVPGFFFRKDH